MIFDRVRTVRPLHPSTYKSGRFNGKTIPGRFSHDPVTIDLNHLTTVAAKAKGRLVGADQAAAATRTAVAAALAKRAALRRNPKCIALDKSVREGKGKCKPGKGIFCNARNCWAKKECALCEP